MPSSRTPLGLPSLFPRSLYRYGDYFSFLLSAILVPLLLEGDALRAYLVVLVSHGLLIGIADYDQTNSSLIKKWTGLNVVVDLKYMFYYDCCVTALSCYFPFKLKGFSVLATKVIFLAYGISPLPVLAFIDYGDKASNSSNAALKKAE